MTPTQVKGKAYLMGDPAVSVPVEPQDKVAVALDRLLGTSAERLERAFEAFSDRTKARLRIKHRGVLRAHREFPSLRAESFLEVYEHITGDSEPYGRVREAIVQNDWARALGDSLGRRLLMAYAEADYGERSIMQSGSATSLRKQRVVGVEGVDDLPQVNPETQDYTQPRKPLDWEIPFDMLQRGMILSISRRVIMNNDVGLVNRTIENLGRAARRTLSRQVWNLWVNNSAYSPDGLAWFHATHGNLQSVALSAAELKAAIDKLLAMTEPGSAEKLGVRLRPGRLWLTVPPALWNNAFTLNQTTGDSLYHLFGRENENIIVNPLLTDTSDWGVHRDSADVESVRADFLLGREEPEFFLADLDNADQLFVADKLLYKLRHEYGVVVAEYRGAVKAVVP